MFVVFVLLCVLLGKFAWPAIIKMMTDRADLIDKGVAYAEEAKEHVDNAKAEADKFILEAQKQQAEILREAARMKAQIIEEAKEKKENKHVMAAAAGSGPFLEALLRNQAKYPIIVRKDPISELW